MKRILMYLQLSRRDSKGRYLLSGDSNWNFMKHIINMLAENKYSVDVIIPKDYQRVELLGILTGQFSRELNKRIKFIKVTYADDVFNSRFYFGDDIIKVLKSEHYDIIWCNDPCLSQNFKIFSPKSKIITYNHWVDFPSDKKSPKGFTYMYRQAEAAEISDIYLFNSYFHVAEFLTQFKHMNLSNAGFASLPPILDNQVMQMYNDRIKILYNHRLASQMQYKKAFESFCKLISKFKKNEFDVYVTNPENKKLKLKVPKHFYIVPSTSVNDYHNILRMCNTSISTFTYPAGWAMGIADCIANEYNVLTLSHSGYKEMLPKNSYSQCKDVKDIEHKLKILLHDRHVYEKSNITNKQFAIKHYSYDVVKQKLEKILNEL